MKLTPQTVELVVWWEVENFIFMVLIHLLIPIYNIERNIINTGLGFLVISLNYLGILNCLKHILKLCLIFIDWLIFNIQKVLNDMSGSWDVCYCEEYTNRILAYSIKCLEFSFFCKLHKYCFSSYNFYPEIISFTDCTYKYYF